MGLLSWPSLPQFLLKTPLRFSLPRQYLLQPSLLLRLVNTLVLPLFKALPLTWLIYPRLLRLRLLTHWPLMPTLLALSPSPLPLFSPEFNLPMLSHPLSPPPPLPLSPLPTVATPMPTTTVPTVPTLPTLMLPMLVPIMVTPMLVPTVPMVDMVDMVPSVDAPMPSPWQLPKPNKSEKIRKK